LRKTRNAITPNYSENFTIDTSHLTKRLRRDSCSYSEIN